MTLGEFLRKAVLVIFVVIVAPVVLGTAYGTTVAYLVSIASWISMALFYSLQNQFSQLFWVAFVVAIANTVLTFLKSWMAHAKGEEQDDIGTLPIGWGNGLFVAHLIAILSGIGVFTCALIVKL